jgi:hypothetical protein
MTGDPVFRANMNFSLPRIGDVDELRDLPCVHVITPVGATAALSL